MYRKIILLWLCSTCCCPASLRVVKPASLGSDKSYDVPTRSQQKKNSDSLTEENSGMKLQLISQTPENNSTEFNSNKIVLTFNRKIILDTEKIIVSCGEKDSFGFTSSGERLIITPSTLKKDTTYQINCTNAIKDFDKGYCDNIIISFSTGKEISKGCIRGKVLDVMNNRHAKDCFVALYKSSDKQDNIINSENPLYFMRTNDNGEYCFEHLANDSYFVCAGMVERGLLRCDPKKNKYGFYKDPVNVSANETKVDVDILTNEADEFKLVSKTVEEEKYILTFNCAIKKINSLTTDIKSKSINNALLSYVISDDKCSVIFYHSSFPLMLTDIDTIPCHMNLLDELDTILDCNFELAFIGKRKDQKKEKYKLSVEHKDKFLTTNSLIDFRIVSNKDIEHIAADNIILYLKDGLDYKYVIDKKLYSITVEDDKHSLHVQSTQGILDTIKTMGDKIDLNSIVTKDINIELVIKKNAIVLPSREDTEEKTFSFKYSKNFGHMRGQVHADSMHVKIQLLDMDCKIIDTVKDCNSFSFRHIPEGKYKLRAFFWPQEQHAWSYGDINYKKPHDPLIFYKNDIDVMNNSDIKNIDINYPS